MAQYFVPATEKDLGVDYRFIIAAKAKIPEDADAVGITFQADKMAFARMLAKIALGFAIARAGHDAFIPFVRDIITGKDGNVHRYVGGFCEEIPKPEKKPELLHSMRMNNHDGLCVVEMQLFAAYGGPVNYVIVGAFKNQFVNASPVQSIRAPRINLK